MELSISEFAIMLNMAQCLQVGIIGLPNVGKSTLFNALLKKQQALAANYPFATIEPNVGVVPVLDSRLEKLAEITKYEEKMANLPPIKNAVVQFVDIAGLVKGASEGAGLGNKFLSHIREVQIIVHVVRAFEDANVIKEGSVDPKSDFQTIETELILADLATLENAKSKVKNEKLQSKIKSLAVEKLLSVLDKGVAARDAGLSEEEKDVVKDLFLLSAKPELIVLNVSEQDYTPEKIEETIVSWSSRLVNGTENFVVICAKIESELSSLSEQEQKEYLADLGLQQSGLERLIQKAYEKLGLISFLTAGENEVKAWTIKKGINAQNAAGVIHNDFIKHFIKAEVVSFNDFVQNSGWKKARENGKARFEGRDYIVDDGDVIEFKVNV